MKKQPDPTNATNPVQRERTPVRSVKTPVASRNAEKPAAPTRNGPAALVETALLTNGICVSARCAGVRDRDERHRHADDAGERTGKRDPGKLPGAPNRRLRLFEHTPEGSEEVDEDERREHQRERADPPLDVIMMRPLDPLLFRRDVVRGVADRTRQPADDEERCERDAGQRQEALPRRHVRRSI